MGDTTVVRPHGDIVSWYSISLSAAIYIGIEPPFPVCLEYNILGGNGKEERPSGEICVNGIYVEIDGKRNANYCTLPTVKKTMNGDKWVTAELMCKTERSNILLTEKSSKSLAIRDMMQQISLQKNLL